MKSQDTDCLPVDSPDSMPGHRPPTLIFTSRGSRKSYQTKSDTFRANRATNDASKRASFRSGDIPSNVGTSGHRKQSTVMNGNSNTGFTSIDTGMDTFSTVPSNSEVDFSLENRVLPLPTQPDANATAEKRKSWTVSKTSSSLTRRYSYDVNPAVQTKPPPLIPAPKSFLYRQSSLSSSTRKDEFQCPPPHNDPTTSPSTNINQDVLSGAFQPSSPPQLPPTPALTVNYNNSEEEDANGNGSQRQQPSFLEPASRTHTSQHSQTSPVVTSGSTLPSPSLPSYPSSLHTSPSSLPHPHFRFPSPPRSPPPPSPILLEEPSVSNTSALITLSPHFDDGRPRKGSVSPSEAMEYLDEAIADHRLSSSSLGDALVHSDSSPELSAEHIPEYFTSYAPKAAEPEDSPKETEANIVAIYSSNATLLPHPDITSINPQIVTSHSRNTETLEKVKDFKDAFGNISHHPKHDVRASSPDHIRTDEHKLPDKPQEQKTRKTSISPKKTVEVLKLQPNIKTVRQQIKPGIVGELASLFQHMGDEYDISSPSGLSYLTTDQTVRNHESCHENSEQQSIQTATSDRLNGLNDAVFNGKEGGDINIVITSCSPSQSSDNEEQIQSKSSVDIVEQIQSKSSVVCVNQIQSKSSMDIVEQSQLKSVVDTVEQTHTKSVVDTASVEDSRIKPGLDYLSASKEIFNRMTESRSQCEANIAKTKTSVDRHEIHAQTETSVDRHETHDFALEDITFPSLLASSTPNKIDKKKRFDIENGNNDSYTNITRTEPLEINMKFSEDTADLNTTRDETASTVTKSTNSDNRDGFNLTTVEPFEGAPDKPDHVKRADGTAYGDVNSFSKDDKERPSSHGYYSAISNEPSSTVVKEVSTHHDQSVSKLELRANIKQDDEACVTHSQPLVVEGGTHGSQDDELNPRTDNCQWNVAAVINPPRPRPLSHVTSRSERLTTDSTQSTNNFMNSNNSQAFTCVKNDNTLGETPVAKTGSENQIQTNKSSLRSKFSFSTQTVSNSQSNSDDREWGSDNITSFTSQQNPVIVTAASNHGGVIADGGMNLDLSPASRHDHIYRPGVNDDVKHITANKDVYSTRCKNDGSVDDEISYREHGVQVKATRGSSFTVDLTPTRNQVEDYLHKQTVNASFQPLASSENTILAGSVQDAIRIIDDVDLNSQRLTDQVSDADLFVKVPEPVKLHKSYEISDDVEINGIEQFNTDSSVTQHSDDFLSILDDITIQTDITSGFLGSSRRSGKYPSEKHEHSEKVSHLVDIYENRTQEHSSQKAMKADVKHMLNESSPTYDSSGRTFNEPTTETMEREAMQFDHSLPASTEITSVTSFLPMRDHDDLNEEIRTQHDVLSPRLSEHAEYEKVLHRDTDSIRSYSSSVSSTAGSQKGRTSGTGTETMFNRDFFSKSEMIPGKEDALKKATVHNQLHAEIFKNTQNSSKTVNNLNEHEDISHPEWVTPVDMPRLIPWSDYESRAQIPLTILSAGSSMESSDTTSHRSSISSTGVDVKEPSKAQDTAVTRDVFSKQQVTSNTVERRLTRKESLITASKVLRSIPWGEYEDKLNVDAEPTEPAELAESSSSDLLQQELRKVTGSRLSSQGPADSADGSFARTGNEIYEEKHQQYDMTYSADIHDNGYHVTSNDYRDHANDSNNNILPISVTPESSSVTQCVTALPQVVSNEQDDMAKQKQDEIHMSKNKFQALKNVFEQQDFENHPKPTAGFLAKRDSFKFGASRKQPTTTVSRAENDRNGGMSIEVGANVTSQHETGVHVSRDTDQRGVDVDVERDKKATEIDTTERRDSQCTDTYSETTDGGLVDTPGTRDAIKKSQQTSLAYDVQTGELLRHSLSRNSSVRSSSSSLSVNSAERLSSHIQSVSGHLSTDTEAVGKPHTRSWTTTVNGFDLDKHVELPHISESSSLTGALRENDGLEIPTGSSENTSSGLDKQTDLIDAFLKSTIGSKNLGLNQTSLSEIQEIRKPARHTGVDKSDLIGDSRQGSFGQTEEYNSDSHHDDEAVSFPRGIGSVNLRSDQYPEATVGYSEPSGFHPTNSERRHSDSMTALVGETSSFSIHKKITTREESFGVQSETSATGESPRENTFTRHSQSATPDVYLIADKKGEYYALQEVDGEDDGGSVVTDNLNLHLVEMSRTDGHSRAVYDPGATDNDHYPKDGDITDVYIDSSAVDNDKARELISAYLDSQELNRQHNNTTNDVHSYQDHSTTQQHYSRTNYSEDVGHRHASVSDGNTGRSHAVYNSGAPGTSGFVSSTDNGSIIIQQNGYSGSATHSNHADSRGYINSSTHQQHSDIANNFAENSYMSNSSHFGQLNASTGDRDSFTSSYNLTRLSTPHLQGSSAVVDTAFGTHRPINQTPDSAGHTFSQSGVTPFQTTPLTITTTTQAVVGEQVGMRINYPPNGASDAFISSSDEETNQKRYIVKNVQQKSSLKKSSKYDPRSFSDSNSDVFTPVASQYNTIGTSRDFLQSHDVDSRHTRSFNGSESFSPRSPTDEPAYRVYQTPSASHSLPRSSNEHDSSYTQENSYISSRQDENNLYKVRNLSTSVPDGLQYIGDHRGRSGKRSPSYADTKNAFKSVKKQHHSPERIFKNAKLSLRKDDYDNDYYSGEEEGNALYRTVTKVYLNENKPRSRSQSPDTRYKVSSVQSSYEKKQDLDETDSGYQEQHRRYIVVGTSDNSEDRHGVSAHSSPKLDRKVTKSFEEATITRTELVQPSRVHNIPPSTKTHKTVIQLESAENTTKDRDISHGIDSQYMIKRAKSVEDLHTESRSTLTASSQERDMWRTGQLRSHSNSEDEEVDRQQTNAYATTPRLVKTFQQEDGEKLYVINSTVPRGRDRDLNHPAGWYKSTIDINQNRPEKAQSVGDLLSRSLHEDRFDSSNYTTEKSIYFVREAAPQTSTTRTFRGNHSAEFAYPDSGTGTEVTSSDGENELRQKFERVERIYEVRSQPDLPEHFQSMEDLSNDLRVLRGNILIKNRLNDTDHGVDGFDENVNLFDNSFHLGKDNPLFSSDPDILASLQREEQALASHVHQDITFETVDKIAHEYRQEKQVQRKEPAPRKKQNLSQLLLSKLANVDSKDIRQTIDVEHHNEEIYGDIDFIHADGERKTSSNTRNFDSVNEKVELTLTQGKAFVIIKVIAERIVPTDYEFNVWRKSQAIVTRQIEIDLLANEQRRRLYKHVMASAGTSGSLEGATRSHYYDSEVLSAQERQLSSMETLKLFSQILDVTEGQGDKDYTETQTRQEMGQLPAAAMDLLY